MKDGVIVPNFSHGEIIEAVFRRTRVTVGLMTSAKLLSAVEPIILYQRRRFRGGQGAPGTPRYELGIQQKEDALHRLVDIWSTGEASASLGFEAARVFDELDPLEKEKDRILAEKGLTGRAAFKELSKVQDEALAAVNAGKPVESHLAKFVLINSVANVLCPACKLWNTGHGATMMREAVSLMGGYGVTEDCPGFLGQKWMDAQLEATYEGPEAVQRLQLSITMTNELFLAQFKRWIIDMKQIASERPGTGACALGTAMKLWLWTLEHIQNATDADGVKLYHKTRQGVTFPLADALCWLLAARQFILDVIELEKKGAESPALADSLPGLVSFYTDLCHTQVARAAGEVGRICAEIVHGYNRHPAWDDNSCHAGSGVSGTGGGKSVQSRPMRQMRGAGAVRSHLRAKLDTCITGCRLAKDRAAEALTKVMTREALDYPV